MTHILRIDASMRHDGSTTRDLTDRVIARLAGAQDVQVISRDLAQGIEIIDQDWIAANFTADEDRTDDQKARLAFSDELISELQAVDTIVIGTPIYNFGVPAALKAWIDLIARARVTFRYSENGPVGLLTGKRAIIAVASGGTEVGSEIDFATPYLRHALSFIGIAEVEIVAADKQMVDGDAAIERARADVLSLAA